MSTPPVALIDFPEQPTRPDAARQQLRFGTPSRWLLAHRLDEVRPVLDAAHAASRAGSWCVGIVRYEAAAAFEAAVGRGPGVAGLETGGQQADSRETGSQRADSQAAVGPALAAFAVFDTAEAAPLPMRHDAGTRCSPWEDDLGEAGFAARVEAIQAAIRRGEVYQVNLTTRLFSQVQGDPLDLFATLRRHQPGGYGLYLELPDGGRVLSASPELFFDWRDGLLRTQPMKGTAPRGASAALDGQAAGHLVANEKDRAENLMIVDLLRNDLARVAEVGSVRVSRLFELHALPTVWQMTSTIEARTRSGLTLSEVFAALFPCGSVTGAPKIAAMQAIAALETGPRGVYCGAAGVLQPGGAACFNVPIRTVELRPAPLSAPPPSAPPMRSAPAQREPSRKEPAPREPAPRIWTAVCGIGSGITLDSSVAGEAAEWRHKRRFLQRCEAPFELLESLRLQDGRVWLIDAHLDRLAASAQAFAVPLNAGAVREALQACARAHPRGIHKLRLRVDLNGHPTVDAEPLAAPDRLPWTARGLLSVALAHTPIDSDGEFVAHKTTRREAYAPFRAPAGHFDTLLWNAGGELTEFTVGNLALLVDGRWCTPALSAGLLAGTYRGQLLQAGRLKEARLTLPDLTRATAGAFLNSVRGWLPIDLEPLRAAVAARSAAV